MRSGFPDKRQTGRSTRMLQEAERLSREGRRVIIVVSSNGLSHALNCMARDMGLQLYRVSIRHVEGLQPWDWRRLRPCNDPEPDAVYLIDHHIFELAFGPMLHEWQRFDLPEFEPSKEVPQSYWAEVHKQFMQLIHRDGAVKNMLSMAPSLKSVIVHLANQVVQLKQEVEKLRLISPRRLRDPCGKEYIYRCPDDLVPCDVEIIGEGDGA